MKKSIILVAFAMVTGSLSAQTLIFEEKGWAADTTLKRGENTYTHPYFTVYGMGDYFINQNFSIGGSIGFDFGLRHIREFGNRYAMGGAFSVDIASHRVADTDLGMFKTQDNLVKENLELTHLHLEYFNRFTFGKSGDRIGNFLDLGIRGYRTVGADVFAEYDPGRYTSTAEIRAKNVNFVYRWHYGLTARLGFNKFVVTGAMRLSESLKSNAPYLTGAELPKYSLGFQIGLHK